MLKVQYFKIIKVRNDMIKLHQSYRPDILVLWVMSWYLDPFPQEMLERES